MLGLIFASSICGLLFGQFFKLYSLIPALVVVAGLGYFLATQQGWASGILSVVLATMAMQFFYFLSVGIGLLIENFKPAKAPSEEFL